MKKLTNKKGFTLTELIVVIVIIGILAAVLIPSLTSYITKSRLTSAQQDAVTYVKNYAAEATELDGVDGSLQRMEGHYWVHVGNYWVEVNKQVAGKTIDYSETALNNSDHYTGADLCNDGTDTEDKVQIYKWVSSPTA